MYECSPGTTIEDGKIVYREQMERAVTSAGVSR
jgi:hypothetical protein